MTVWIHSPFDNLPHEGFRTQRYWLLSEAFAAAGDEVVYWTSDFNHGTKASRRLAPYDSSVALRTVPTPAYRANVSLKRVYSHLVYARRLKQAIATASKPDLIVSAVPTLGAASALLDFARACGARFVVDVQDAWPETFGRLGLPKALLLPLYREAKRLYRAADRVIGVSERYRAIVGRKDYRVYPHGILSSSSPSATPSTTSLLYLGNLGAGYDLSTVLKALVAEPSLTLEIAGRGPREAALRREVDSLGLGGRVRFHGYLSADALGELAKRSAVGVIPMRDDSWVGLPYKLGDYLAAGLPVLSSLHGECGELLTREGVGAVYDFGSPTSLLKALKALPAGRVALPDSLRADRIYPRLVADLKEGFV